MTTETSILVDFDLSYYVAVIQWITSCHKRSYDHTCNNTLARLHNVSVSNAFSS